MVGGRTAIVGVLVCAALALAGCNFVMTVSAIFTPADAGGPSLKPGYWSSPYCTIDAAANRESICAQGYLMTASEMRQIDQSGAADAGEPHQHEFTTYLLVAGDPMVMQLAYTNPEVGPEPGAYVFIAVKPTALDASGRIVAATVWPVLCGPPAPQPKPDAPVGPSGFPPSTNHPFAGITLGDAGCIPADKAALSKAAKASRALADIVLDLHWVADAAP